MIQVTSDRYFLLLCLPVIQATQRRRDQKTDARSYTLYTKKKTYKINTTAFRFHFLQYTKVFFNLATAGKFSQYNGLGHAI